jgi:antitoxin VapB
LALALNIRNPEANRLAAEVAALAGESKTDAVILALRERLQRLRSQQAAQPDAREILANRLDQIALRCAGRPIRDQRAAEQILGYDASGLPS